MMKLQMCTCLLLSLSFAMMEVLNISGRVGNNLGFTCSNWKVYWDIREYAKYLCKSPCSEGKHIIVKAEYKRDAKKNRIEIINSRSNLYVTFINLQKSDAGKYYCGVEVFGTDPLIEVNIKVLDAVPPSPEKTHTAVSVPISPGKTHTAVSVPISPGKTPTTVSVPISPGKTPTVSVSADMPQGTGHALCWILGFAVVITLMVTTFLLTRMVMKKNLTAGTSQQDPGGKVKSTFVTGDHDGVYQNLNLRTIDGQMVNEVLTSDKGMIHSVYEAVDSHYYS